MIPRLWPKETIVCIASGPSLTSADALRCRQKARVLTINDGVMAAPWAEAMYAAEHKWWDWKQNLLQYFPRLKVTCSKTAAKAHQLLYVEPTIEFGLSLDPSKIAHGGHSGYGGVNVAYHLGGKRIVLLGYDMQPGPQGEHHFFGAHPDNTHLAYPSRLRGWPRLYEALTAQGVELLNATRETAITCVPRVKLEDLF